MFNFQKKKRYVTLEWPPRVRPRLRWLDIIDSHLKGKNTSLKKVLETKCFENIQDWSILISRPTDRSSGEAP